MRFLSFQIDAAFQERLRTSRGFEIVTMVGDGACLFRAVAYHVFSDQEMHGTVREACVTYMVDSCHGFGGACQLNFAVAASKSRSFLELRDVKL